MLEDQSSLVSRPLPDTCGPEQKWVSISYYVIKDSDSEANRLSQGRTEIAEKESHPSKKHLSLHNTEENNQSHYSFLSPAPADASDHGEEQSDQNSLIPALGRDISINCLLHLSRSSYGTIASLNRSFLSLVQSGELYKLRRQAEICEEWIYFSCNVLEWEGFDPYHRHWMRLPRMPRNECFMCSDKQSLAVGTELLVFGKEIDSHIIFRYSILTNSWSSGMRMNTPRCLFCASSLGEIAILAGGYDSQGTVLNSAELYNSENRTWETLPPMNKPRKMCSSAFMDGKFYVIGGHIGNAESYTCGEEYNFETRTWRVIPDMYPIKTAANEPPPLLAVLNNQIYAADYTERELRKYDKENNSWITLGRLPERAVSMNGWGLAFRACGEQLITIGGPRRLGGGIVEINSWVPGDGPPEWELLASKPSGSFVYNCAVMGC